jgi:hypothetical protein
MVKLRRLSSAPIYTIINSLPMASIGPSGAENTIGSMVQYDDQVISLRLLRRNACKSLGLGLSLGRLIVLVEGAIRLDFTDFETGFRP